MRPLFAYIPSNLDFSSDKHGDKYYFIITYIFYGRIFDKRKNSNSYIQLYSTFIKAILTGRYKEHIQELMNRGVIETDNHYIRQKKSKSYRLTAMYQNQKIKQVRIMDGKIISKYWKYKIEQKKKKYTEIQFSHLYECLEQIEIDHDQALEYLNHHAGNFEQYNSWYSAIGRVVNKDWFFIVDKTAGRVHHNISSLPKIFRPFLSCCGNCLFEVDISNSQPLLFNILISNYFLRNTSIYNCGINIPYVPQNSDLRKYKEVTEAGKFYEYMMKELGIIENRDRFKIRMFSKIFYGKNYNSEEMEGFKKLFPTVYKILCYYKKINYKDLSIELQRVEAEIMINSVLQRLAEKSIFGLTIHDSILTTDDNIELVKEIIMDEFNKYYLIPTITVKRRV